jgi:hypothetical protein
VNASTVAISQATASTAMTGHGSSRIAGSGGGSGASVSAVGSEVITDQRNALWLLMVLAFSASSPLILCDVKDVDARLASNLALAVDESA